MPVKPALNPRIKDVASGLIMAGKFTKDREVETCSVAKLTCEQRLDSSLGIDEAILPAFEQHNLLPIMALVDGELVLSERALEEARDAAYEANFEDMALVARSLLSELSMRTRPTPVKDTDERPVPKRPAVVMNDYVSWPSMGTVMRGRDLSRFMLVV